MPELPEVETIRRDLQKQLIGDSITEMVVKDARLLSPTQALTWPERIYDQKIMATGRKGKYLSLVFANGWKIVFHLRMTGQILIGSTAEKYRMRLTLASGRTLDFQDERRFGEVWLLGPDASWPSRAGLGPDAVDELTSDLFVEAMKKHTTRVHSFLMDQRRLAGVGNIYAQEALFKARIRPSKPANRVSRSQAAVLFTALQDTLRQAIKHRGSTSRNYRDAQGDSGEAQLHHDVYQKGGTPCPRCGQRLVATRIGGRGAVYCSKCQK